MVEDRDKTLYIRLPHTIKNMDEIRDLFVGDVQIKLPRQSSRHCHVTFTSVQEKIKNLREIKKKMIDNRRIVARNPKVKSDENRKKVGKKLVIPTPRPEPRITRILYVTNINKKTKLNEIKKLFGNCKSATFLDNSRKPVKKAIVKLTDLKLAADYLRKERPWPVLHGNKLIIKPDTRKQKKKKPGLKIYDGEVEIKNDVDIESENIKTDEKKSKDKKGNKVKSKDKKKETHNESTTTVKSDDEEEE